MARPGFISGRAVAAIITGVTAFLLFSLVGEGSNAFPGAATAVALLIATPLAVWAVARAARAKSAWGRACLVNGVLSAMVGVAFRAQGQPWSAGSQSPDTVFVGALAARIGIVAFVIAAVLIALSLCAPRRKF